jgi:PAS domain S-box-containing protein
MINHLSIIAGISDATRALLDELNLELALQTAVSSLGKCTQVDRCYIFQTIVLDEKQYLSQKYEWAKKEVSLQINNPDLQLLPFDQFEILIQILEADANFYGLVREAENDLFRSLMQAQEIQTFLFTPIMVHGRLWGFIGYDDCQQERAWERAEVDALATVAKNIGIRIARDLVEAQLNTAYKQLELSIEAGNLGIWLWNIPENKISFSSIYLNMLGYQKGEVAENYDFWFERIHPKDQPKVKQIVEDCLDGKIHKYDFTYRMLHRDGRYCWIWGNGQLERDKDGHPSFLTGYNQDISAQKEKDLRLELLSENGSDIISMYSLTGTLEFISQAVFEHLGFTPDELLGKTPLDYLHPEDLASLALQELIDSGTLLVKENETFSTRLLAKNGKYIWFESTISHLSDNYNGIYGYLAISRNITERIAIEKERELTLAKSIELNALKSEFISMASHQFRTPLTVILSNVELIHLRLKKAAANDLLKHSSSIFKRITDEVNRLTRLMDNILIVGRQEQLEDRINLQPICLFEFLNNLIALYFQKDEENNIIKLGYTGEERQVPGDELLLTHAFTNIISNAIKYSKDRKLPELTLHYHADSVEICLQDYGIGIPKNEIDKVFNSFYRASNALTIQGTGLGLKIVKDFITQHGGTIYITSEINQGTTVKISLPYANQENSSH